MCEIFSILMGEEGNVINVRETAEANPVAA